LLATMAHVVVVVETAIRGGARNAAGYARKRGRPVLVVPGAPWNPRASGCLVELRGGARMVTSFRDVLERLPEPFASIARSPDLRADSWKPGSGKGRRAPKIAVPRSVDPDGHLVVSAVESGAVTLDHLCDATGLSVARAQALILTLTLEGILVCDPSGRLSLVRR